MTEPSKPKIADLELNKETLSELTDGDSEQAKGGAGEAELVVGGSQRCRSRVQIESLCLGC